MQPAAFNLRLRFGLAAFGVIALLTALFAVLLSQFMSQVMLEREVAVTRELLQNIVQSHQLDAESFRPHQIEATDLAYFVDDIRDLPEILRANIYATDKSVLWSTDAAIISQHFDDNDELDEALTGRTVSQIVSTAGDIKTEHVALAAAKLGYYIEAYIPLQAAGSVIAVVEIYKLPATLDAVLRRGTRIVWTDLTIGALVLFGTLYTIVDRAARLIQRQQTEISHMEALAALGQMAGAIAHNLRNPMAGIRSSAELLKLEVPAASDMAGDIIGEVDYLERCVRQLLEFTRTDAVAPQPVDPLMLVNDILSQQRRSLARDAIAVTVEDERQTPRQVQVDPLLIGQAMTSVIVNAREAMATGGTLLVQLQDHGPRLCITYTDSGPGVPPEMLARIGEPFFTTKTRGLGLGLVLARRIVERFGGSLRIDNAGDRGARVQIELAAV
jgi:two-component system sensor histidine kinase HydH